MLEFIEAQALTRSKYSSTPSTYELHHTCRTYTLRGDSASITAMVEAKEPSTISKRQAVRLRGLLDMTIYFDDILGNHEVVRGTRPRLVQVDGTPQMFRKMVPRQQLVTFAAFHHFSQMM